jgi:hypothetical protein
MYDELKKQRFRGLCKSIILACFSRDEKDYETSVRIVCAPAAVQEVDYKVKVKDKFTHVPKLHATKSYRRRGGKAPGILNFCSRPVFCNFFFTGGTS